MGFPSGSAGKELACQCRRCCRHGFDSWVEKISWRRAWQLTPVLLPWKYRQEEPGGLRPMALQESDITEATEHTHIYFSIVKKKISNNLSINNVFSLCLWMTWCEWLVKSIKNSVVTNFMKCVLRYN